MAIVRKYKSVVTDFVNPAPGLYQVKFLSLSCKYFFKPGQFLHLALDEYNPSMQWPESRCFSMQNNPNNEHLKITFSVKGKFTQRMANELKVGKEIWLKLPYGDLFTQPHNKTNTVFIAGGTGITPFLTLFSHESFNKYINPHFYLSFRTRAYNIYNNELSSIKSFVDSVKTCETKIFYEDIDGRLDVNRIFYENGINSDYFISGPPIMVKAFKQVLVAKGVPTAQVLTDDWE